MTEKSEKSDKEPIRLSDLQNRNGKGLVCGRCGCRHFRVLHTRPVANGILRERECRNCGKVVHTKEKL